MKLADWTIVGSSFRAQSQDLTISCRYPLSERDDSLATALSRGVPALQCHTSQRSSLPWSSGHRKDLASPRTRCQLSGQRETDLCDPLHMTYLHGLIVTLETAFFMRKGADCLSKWVGEAERQLRLLFEEAKNCQPSIIFFDEIDGLAPVRSSKQDQIHASIVSTLLALMDGMDGRGQVIVIGATNRPDAIDPALRRPGRFDREFYFPLPGLAARERILEIMTNGWDEWEGEKGIDNKKCLAKMTKGYGGADLRVSPHLPTLIFYLTSLRLRHCVLRQR
jgi:hypothetical protein